MASFGEMIKLLRQKKSLTQAELAEALSAAGIDRITRSAVGMWETGERIPKFEVVETIADYFNVDIDYLTGKESDTRSQETAGGEIRARLLKAFDQMDSYSQEIFAAQAEAALAAQRARDTHQEQQ